MSIPAEEEHIKLSDYIKSIHKDLREASKIHGAEEAWKTHLKDKEKLETYAKTMRDLSLNHWKKRNTGNEDRIQWTITCCEEYFNKIVQLRDKELRIIERLKIDGCEIEETWKYLTVGEKISVLDVGSCGNFFKHYEKFEITAIDIAPSSSDVYNCDFISVPINDELIIDDGKIKELKKSSFDVVIFSLLLEYMPSSDQRIKCCQQAYQALKTEGILIIITPDSKNQHKNMKLLKTWRWVLAQMGFRRIKIEKLMNLSCLAFRKSLIKEIPSKWAETHGESYMEHKLEIPQDRNKNSRKNEDNVDENEKKKIKI